MRLHVRTWERESVRVWESESMLVQAHNTFTFHSSLYPLPLAFCILPFVYCLLRFPLCTLCSTTGKPWFFRLQVYP
jgi:hypothetical protein